MSVLDKAGRDRSLRVSFGLIVLNGEPFLRYNLRALYPFAHQIIVVEGAVRTAACIASPDGHSTDGTLDTLRRFKSEEDPDNKVDIVKRDGFWIEKKEQSQEFSRRATGDILWIIGVDEFYHSKDMLHILRLLQANPDIAAVTVRQITFWGGFDYVADGWYLRQGSRLGPGTVLRVCRWGPEYTYVSHRPLTIHDQDGVSVTHGKVLSGHLLARRGIFMYHYSLLFPRQVREKAEYYSGATWANSPRMSEWAERSFGELRHPYRVHNVYRYPSWLERFTGRHPEQIEALRGDLAAGRVKEAMRPSVDIEMLLLSRTYRAGRALLKVLGPLAVQAVRLRRLVRQWLMK
jgi:hypothetical protein